MWRTRAQIEGGGPVRLVLGRTVPVPHPLAGPVWRAAFRIGYSSFPAEEFDFIRYVCMVDGSRALSELGYRPRHSPALSVLGR